MKNILLISLLGCGVFGFTKFDKLKPIVINNSSRMTLQEAISTIPDRYNVSPDVVQVLLAKESYGGKMDTYRYEPGQMKHAAKITKNENTQRMLASSHCAFQIMGLTAHGLKVKWSDLYDAQVCTELAMRIFSRNKEVCSKKNDSTYSVIKCAARRYNGSGPLAEKYSIDFMARLSKRIIDRSSEIKTIKTTKKGK